MNVSLTPELEEFVNQGVTSGMYHSASEVVRAGLRLLKEQNDFHAVRLESLKQEIARGIEQAERGEKISGDEVFQRLRERNAEMTNRK